MRLNLPAASSTKATNTATVSGIQTSRFSPVADDYKFIGATAPGDSSDIIPKSPTARFARLPSYISAGSYTQDTSDPATLLKSYRSYTPKLNTQLAGGEIFRVGKKEIDHIIPLWAGGTDLPENKEALDIEEHGIKSKAQAVPLALYRAGKIDLPEARVMALTWKDKDVTGINLNAYGQVSVKEAEKINERWKKPVEVGMSDVLKTWGKKLGSFATLGKYKGEPSKTDKGEQLYSEALSKGSRGVVGQFAQGVGSGATLGYLPAAGNDGEEFKETVARGAGQLVGTLASFSWLGKLAGAAAKGIWGATKVGNTGKTVAKLPAWLEKLRKTDVALKGGKTFATGQELGAGTALGKAMSTLKKAKDFGEIVVPKNAAFNALMGAGLFTLHGQLSKQEENDFQGRVKRFLSDAAYGSLLSLPTKSLKAAKSLRYAENFKQSAYLGAGVYALSSLEGADAGEALLNSAVIVGLHGMGLVGYKRKMDPFLNNIANKERAKWGLEPIGPKNKLTEEMANKEIGSVFNKIVKESDSLAEGAKNLNALVTANRQLYKGGLSRERRLTEDMKDMKSITKRTNELTEAQLDGVPDNVTAIFNALNDGTINKKKIEKASVSQPLGAPTNLGNGLFAGTGFASNADPIKNKNLIEYVKARDEAIASRTPFSDTLVIERVTDPKELEFYRIKSENSDTPFDPNTILNVYGSLNGKKTYLATVPMSERLNRPVTGIRASQAAAGLTPDMIPAENMHNETLIKLMEERGINALTGTARYATDAAKRSGEPFLNFTIADEDWSRAQAIKELLNKETSTKITDSIKRRPSIVKRTAVVEEPVSDIDPAEQGTILNTITQKYGDESEFFAMYADAFRELLSEKNPKIFAKRLSDEYGVVVSVDNAKKIIEDAENKTVGSFLNFLYNASLSNRPKEQLNDNGKVILNNIISDGYFKGLSEADKKAISALKLLAPGPKPIEYTRTGEIDQKIKLDKTINELSKENIAPPVVVEEPVVNKKTPTVVTKKPIVVENADSIKTTSQSTLLPELSNDVDAISRRPGKIAGTEWVEIGPDSPSEFSKIVLAENEKVEVLVKKGAGASEPIKKDEYLGRVIIDGKEWKFKYDELGIGKETKTTSKEKADFPDGYVEGKDGKLTEVMAKSKKTSDKKLMNDIIELPSVKKASEVKKATGKTTVKSPKDVKKIKVSTKVESFRTPKQKMLDAIRKEIEAESSLIIENHITPAEKSSNLNLKNVINSLMKKLNNITVEPKSIPGVNVYKNDINEIREEVIENMKPKIMEQYTENLNWKYPEVNKADDLLEMKQLLDLPITKEDIGSMSIEDLTGKHRNLLNYIDKSTIQKEKLGKTDYSKKNMLEKDMQEFFGNIFAKVGKRALGQVSPIQKSSIDFKKTLQDSIKNSDKNSYSYGNAVMWDKALTEMFGKKWENDFKLGSFLGFATNKGKKYLGDKGKIAISREGFPEKQSKEVVSAMYKKAILEKKPWDTLSQKEKNEVFSARAEEAKSEAEKKYDKKSVSSVKRNNAAAEDSLEEAIQDYKEDPKQFLQDFNNVNFVGDNFLHNITSADKTRWGLLASDIGLPLNARVGANDARMDILDFIDSYNENFPPKWKEGKSKPEPRKNITTDFLNKIVYSFPAPKKTDQFLKELMDAKSEILKVMENIKKKESDGVKDRLNKANLARNQEKVDRINKALDYAKKYSKK